MTEKEILDRRLNLLRLSLQLPVPSSEAAPNNISPSPVDHDTQVLFDVRVAGQRAKLLHATAAEFRLPLNSSEARNRRDENYKIPERIAADLNKLFPNSGAPLWLVFGPPTGYLRLIPWERLLGARLRLPMLRLPYFDVQPVASRESVDIILCFSFPIAKQAEDPNEIVRRFLNVFPKRLATRTSLHVFADKTIQPMLTNFHARYPKYEVKVYDPEQALDYALLARSNDPDATEEITNPWLLWMRDALRDRSIDVAHFVCHGYFGRDHGGLAFAESPVVNDDEDWARFVGARQLAKFLDRTGAWSAAFSSPPRNFSVGGLRVLQDQLAQLRPGPFLFHDMERDRRGESLNRAYRLLYLMQRSAPPKSEGVVIYCHPDSAAYQATRQRFRGAEHEFFHDRRAASTRAVQEFTLAGRLPQTLEGNEITPSWIAARQRSLECSLATIVAEPESDEQAAKQSGTETALRFAADVYAKYAVEWAKSLGKEMK